MKGAQRSVGLRLITHSLHSFSTVVSATLRLQLKRKKEKTQETIGLERETERRE